MERLIYCIVSYEVGNTFKGKINVGFFYTINYPGDYFEKSIRPHLKISEDLFKMFNGEVEFHSFQNITNREYKDIDLSKKENQLQRDLDKAFHISAKLTNS